MSVQAMTWALEQQIVTDATARHVLLCLANYADKHGRGAFPSVKSLSQDTGLAVRTIRYKLETLLEAGVIRFGNQAIAAAYIDRHDRRPTVYDIAMNRGAPDAPGGERGANETGTGCNPCTNGVQMKPERGAPGAPNPSINPSINPSSKPKDKPTDFDGDSVREIFEFWKTTMGKNNATVLDANRRGRIEWALKHYSQEDARKAIVGCSVTPWNMGENPSGKKHNDLTLIFRSASHVERFIDNADSPPQPSATPSHTKRPVPRHHNLSDPKIAEKLGLGPDDMDVPF